MFGIERNKHIGGRAVNMAFGLAGFGDGIVRILSFGFLHTRWPLEFARLQALKNIKRLKERNDDRY